MPNIFALLAMSLVTVSFCASGGALGEKRLGFTSYGSAHIGMSRAALETAVGSKLRNEYPDSDTEGCEYVVPQKGYKGVSFMLIDQRVARIDISDPKIKTLSGAHIGASEISVKALYRGRIQITPHAYSSPDGSYLTLLSQDGRYGLRFETLEGKIIGFYAGTVEAIQFIEGCL
ncbi:MAG: hypothetical protein J0L88_07240 [Xanthomonadales bacterium]|nr:hypothetical protein [Xanthomonadales bacterium]